jgi:hypothetical protein
MSKMLKFSVLFAATLALAACDSGTSTAVPAAKTGAAKPAPNDSTKTVVQTP